ncbi:MAG: PAS domain S-box protein [Deltaproteobacteria bacterium]|nr:PAS domain S-box protein [Deltaproteobacteria bacterium]
MNASFLGLVQNATFLLAVAFLFDVAASQWRVGQSSFWKALVGLALGAIGITVMLTPWAFGPGIVFDTRSILLGISGLFFGFFPTTIAMAMTAAFRFYQGGTGAWTGIAVILASGATGIAWRHFRRRPLAEISWQELYLFGMVIHLTMLGLMFSLPWATALRVLSNIALPVLVIYPLGAALLGVLMVKRLLRERTEDALLKSEEKFKTIFDRASDGILIADPITKKFLQGNTAICSMLGYTKAEIESLTIYDIHPKEDISRVQDEFGKMIKGEKVLAESLPSLRKDGSIFYADIGAANITIGGMPYLIGIFRDINEKKQAEEGREKMLVLQQGVNLLQQSLLAPATLEEKLRVITDSVVSLFDTDFCRIWLIQPGDLCEQGCVHAEVNEGPHICRFRDRCLHLLASSGRYIHTDGKIHRRVPFGCYKIGHIASEDDHSFLTNDVQNDPRVHNREWARELGLVSFVGYQLRVPGGKTMGVLALFAKHPILSSEDAMLDGLSSTVALVIQRDVAEKSLRGALERLHKAIGTTIQVMVSAVETRDPYTAGHQIRSADLARAIGTEMGLPQEKIDGIRMAGSIHDIGKLSIPAEILSKPTKLTNIEFSLIKEHAQTGYEMLKDVESPWPLAEIVYQHHERMDGSGYPRNLKGDDILMEARIMAISDVVESMASHRPYRPALGLNAALEEIENNKGTFYDANAADACLRLFREKGFQLERA